MSMSREEQSRERERERQRAREKREVLSGLNDRDTQPVVFGVVRRSPTVNKVERILGDYESFRLGAPNTPRTAQDQDAASATQHPKPPHPSSTPSSSSSSSSKSSQPPQSSPGTTTRPPKSQPVCIKPPHPPSTHAHTKNGEVKGNLKGGPGPGPGDGGPGGGGRKSAVTKGLPPLKVDGSGTGQMDPKIQQIMSEMTVRDPVSAIVQTPRHDHPQFTYGHSATATAVAAALAPAPAPSPAGRASKSPVGSAEPKVPIPQVQFVDGYPRLTCTIPLSFIDKVPKPSVSGAPYPVNTVKSEIKVEQEDEEDEEEEEEEEEERKTVLDNRTKEGKGKRKASEPGTKATEDESKRKIIFSIFGNVKRQDHESDDDKVKREVKKEEEESEEERGGRSSSLRPTVTIKQEPGEATPARQPVLASPRSPVSDTSISRQHRKKKQERASPTRERKRPKKGSERHPQESLGLPGGGSSAEGRGRRDGSVESEKWSRKRAHERDSSLESTRSNSRANSECGENHSKKPRMCKSLGTPDAIASSPSSSRAASQRSADDTHHSWPQEKEDPTQLKHPQRPQHSQQSSQDKVDESGSTPCGDSSGYTTSRPVSEHESRVSYRSGEQAAKVPESSEAPWHPGNLAAPHGQRLPGPSTTPNTTASAALPPSRPAGDQALLHGHYANQQERQYTSYIERRIPEINRDYNCYLNRAKQLKHIADEETDRSMQAMKYLEAALYFILSGKAMETDHDASASLTMYKDTLHFIKWVSSVFRRENQEGSINAKLAVISLRCQSLLSLKIYQMRRFEHKDNQRQLNKYFQNLSKPGNMEPSGGNGQQWGGQRGAGSPSHPSQTPSPAGSVGSEGSQSSGYTTSTEGRSKAGGSAPPVGHTPPHPQPPQGAHASVSVVSVPANIHTLIIKQNYLSSHLASAHDMWMEADEYVSKNNIKDFFDELDHQASPLTLHSSLPELVMYVQCGLHRIKA